MLGGAEAVPCRSQTEPPDFPELWSGTLPGPVNGPAISGALLHMHGSYLYHCLGQHLYLLPWLLVAGIKNFPAIRVAGLSHARSFSLCVYTLYNFIAG